MLVALQCSAPRAEKQPPGSPCVKCTAQLWPCHAQQGEQVHLCAVNADLLGGERLGCSDAAHEFASPGVRHPWIIVMGAPFFV